MATPSDICQPAQSWFVDPLLSLPYICSGSDHISLRQHARYLSGKCGKAVNVREFESCKGNVRELTKCQGSVGNNLAREYCLLHPSCLGLHHCLVDCYVPLCIACFIDFAVYYVIVNIYVEYVVTFIII